jgi:hypothetical protein
MDRSYKPELKFTNAIDFGPREITNKGWLFVFLASLLAMVVLCFTIIASSEEITFDRMLALSEQCFNDNPEVPHSRLLASSSAGLVGYGWNIWSFLNGAPGIATSLIAITIGIGVGWVALLKMFAVPIIFTTMAIKVAMYFYMGSFFFKHESPEVGWVYTLLGLFVGLGVIWQREKFVLAGAIMTEACQGIQENPMMFVTLLGVYAGYILFVVLTMSTFVHAGGILEATKENLCVPQSPGWVDAALDFTIFFYLWTTFVYDQLRLATVAGTIGSWYFHKDQRCAPLNGEVPAFPTIFFLKRALTTSLGTLSIGALVNAFVEWFRLKAFSTLWFLDPVGVICRVLYFLLQSVLNSITKYTTVTHVFTGLPFGDSVSRTFSVLRRNFVGAYVVDQAGHATIRLGVWVFSMCMTLLGWFWIDSH